MWARLCLSVYKITWYLLCTHPFQRHLQTQTRYLAPPWLHICVDREKAIIILPFMHFFTFPNFSERVLVRVDQVQGDGLLWLVCEWCILPLHAFYLESTESNKVLLAFQILSPLYMVGRVWLLLRNMHVSFVPSAHLNQLIVAKFHEGGGDVFISAYSLSHVSCGTLWSAVSAYI